MENEFNIYPNTNLNNQNNEQSNSPSNSSILQKILSMLVSGKTLTDILPSITNLNGINPMLASVLSTTPTKKDDKKIESDTIDISHLTKIE